MKQSGFTCDNPTCGTFMVAETLPTGWLVLRVQTTDTQAARDNTFEVCSNRCLAELAIERHEAETDSRFSRRNPSTRGSTGPHRLTPEGRASMQRNGRRSHHVRQHVRTNQPDESCEFCMEDLTAPDDVSSLVES
jgi:hypothetical protein